MTENDADKNTNLTLASNMDEVRNAVLTETDPNKLEDAFDIFNLNIQRKELLRLEQKGNLQDWTIGEMTNRLMLKPGEMSNQDLLNYYKALDASLSAPPKNPLKEAPIIQMNNQVNISVEEDALSKESREKVMSAVTAILKNINTDVIDVIPNNKEDDENE